MRTKCPYCENDDQEKMELYFVEYREHERGELCYQCEGYILSIDTRKCTDEVVTERATIGMLNLDILAQGKGVLPVVLCAWNMVAKATLPHGQAPSVSRTAK
jgi:FdhE protein